MRRQLVEAAPLRRRLADRIEVQWLMVSLAAIALF
jgi:hypothetical protein